MGLIIHAYVENGKILPLDQHLVDTVKTVMYTSLNNRINAVARRIGVERDILLIPVLLHDIGKAIPLYQDRARRTRSYRYHEIVGAAMLYEAFDKLAESICGEIKDYELYHDLLYILIMPVGEHHYAMRPFLNHLDEAKNYLAMQSLEKMKYDVEMVKTLWKSLDSMIHGLLPDKIHGYLCSVFNHIITDLQDKNIQKTICKLREAISDLYTHVSERARYLASAVTGILATADYFAASIRRSGSPKGYPLRVLSPREIKRITDILHK